MERCTTTAGANSCTATLLRRGGIQPLGAEGGGEDETAGRSDQAGAAGRGARTEMKATRGTEARSDVRVGGAHKSKWVGGR